MGKIRRERQKFHITSTVDVGAATADSDKDDSFELPKLNKSKIKTVPMQLDSAENIFANVKIDLSAVNKFVKPQDVTDSMSVVSTKKSAISTAVKTTPYIKFDATIKSLVSGPAVDRQLTKKEKIKLKHEKLLEKIDVVRQSMIKSKKNKKKGAQKDPKFQQNIISVAAVQNNVESGKYVNLKNVQRELVSLNDSLPSLDNILSFKKSDIKSGLNEPMKLKKNRQKGTPKTSIEHKTSISNASHGIDRENVKKMGANKKQFTKSYDLLRKLMKTKKIK